MPRFFIHLRSAHRSLQDCEGTIAADVDAARRLAVATLKDFIQPSTGRIDPEWQGWLMQIADERGRCLFSIPFADAVQIDAREPALGDGDRPSSNVVCLDLERARREFFSVEDEVRRHIHHTTTLVRIGRHDAKSLQEVVEAIVEARQYVQEQLSRSRSQPSASDWCWSGEAVTAVK